MGSEKVTVALTGASGSIGRLVVEACGAGHAAEGVVALKSRLESDEREMRAELAQVAQPFVFIHLAALVLVQECEGNPERAFELNVEGSVRWLKAAAASGCRRFVFVSTGHVFKPTAQLEYMGPERVPDATSVYGRSKIEAEKRLAEEAARLGLELVIARVFSVIGKEMRAGFLYAELVRRVRERDFKPLPGYKNVRDFVEAREAARQLVVLAREGVGGNGEVSSASGASGMSLREPERVVTVHVCSGVPRSVRELALKVFGEHGVTAPEEMFPATDEAANYLVSRLGKP